MYLQLISYLGKTGFRLTQAPCPILTLCCCGCKLNYATDSPTVTCQYSCSAGDCLTLVELSQLNKVCLCVISVHVMRDDNISP